MSDADEWMNETPSADLAHLNEWKELRDKFNGSRAQVYCTNGSRLSGVITFISIKWIKIVRDEQHSAIVNLDYVISIAFENDPS